VNLKSPQSTFLTDTKLVLNEQSVGIHKLTICGNGPVKEGIFPPRRGARRRQGSPIKLSVSWQVVRGDSPGSAWLLRLLLYLAPGPSQRGPARGGALASCGAGAAPSCRATRGSSSGTALPMCATWPCCRTNWSYIICGERHTAINVSSSARSQLQSTSQLQATRLGDGPLMCRISAPRSRSWPAALFLSRNSVETKGGCHFDRLNRFIGHWHVGAENEATVRSGLARQPRLGSRTSLSESSRARCRQFLLLPGRTHQISSFNLHLRNQISSRSLRDQYRSFRPACARCALQRVTGKLAWID